MLTEKVFSGLEAKQRLTFENLLLALKPPLDAPGFCLAMRVVKDCCELWAMEFPAASKEVSDLVLRILKIHQRIENLLGSSLETDGVMIRRISKHPAWAMVLALSECNEHALKAGVGAAILYALSVRRGIPKEFCDAVRRWANGGFQKPIPDAVSFHLAKAHKRACRYFLGGPAPSIQSLELLLKQHFSNRNLYATDRNHQGLVDVRSQSIQQMRSAAEKIRLGVERGSHDDVLAAVSFICGLPMRIAAKLPLTNAGENDGVAWIDVRWGYFHIRLSVLAPNQAEPKGASNGALIHSSEFLSKPLPNFLQQALRDLLENSPTTARTLGELLPFANTSPLRILLDESDVGKIKPSYARFRNGAGAFALEAKLDRHLAALVSGDFRLIPRGRLYYVAVGANILHEACSTYYSELGWGPVVPKTEAGFMGSRIVPTDETVTRWAAWMSNAVCQAHPGKHSSVARLIRHHNVFVNAVASIAIFTLCLRERKTFPIQASGLSDGLDFIALGDKLVGQHPGVDLIPACTLLSEQFEMYLLHLDALNRRLTKLSPYFSTQAHEYICKVLDKSPVPLLFALGDQLEIVSLGSHHLTAWWPVGFQLEANFGRHYWQTHAEDIGIKNLELDAFVRHSQRGNLAWSCGSMLTVDNWSQKLRLAMDAKISHLGLTAIPGLVGRRRV